MLKYLGPLSLMIIVAGCANIPTPTFISTDNSDQKLQWIIEGRAPEWRISINNHRFIGSFPGRYEARVLAWEETRTDDKVYLKSEKQQASIELTRETCSVAGATYPYVAIVKINQQTFTGCAKPRT